MAVLAWILAGFCGFIAVLGFWEAHNEKVDERNKDGY